MVRQEEIRGLNVHIRIHLVGLGVEELSGWDEVLLRRRRLSGCDGGLNSLTLSSPLVSLLSSS